MRNKTPNLRNTSPSPLSSSWTQFHSRFLYLLPLSGTEGWGMGVVVSSSHVVSAAPSSSRSSCAPAWGLSHRSQSSMNFSNVGPSHGLQFLTNCSSVGAFHRVQSFRNRLLQHGSPTGSQVLPANLLQHGLPTESQPLLGIYLLWHGILHGLQVDICSNVDLHGLQAHSLPRLLHGLQGNCCFSAWSSSSTYFFTDLGVCRFVSLTLSHSTLQLQLLQGFFFLLLKYIITEAWRLLLIALASSWSHLEPAGAGSIGHRKNF